MNLRLLLLLHLLPLCASAQNATAKWDGRKRFADARSGKPFLLKETFATINGHDSVHFSRMNGPAFVSLGFYYCGPCRAAMPYFIGLARKRPEIRFIYITYDSKTVVEQELVAKGASLLSLPPNLDIVRMSDDAIRQKGLTMGYPTRYFIHSDGIVDTVTTGGRINHMDTEVADWEAALSGLR